MTKTQFNKIKERLTQWREERHLTYENQQAEFLGNVFKKVSEYFRAKDDLERVDALCDIAVFCFNAFDIEYDFYGNSRMSLSICLNSYLIDKNSLALNNEVNYGMSKIDYYEIVSYILSNIEKQVSDLDFDFDFYKCMLEKIKEIESRTGYYDEKLKKFIKDTSDEAKAKWYKADYESCMFEGWEK
ncbi:hypothetical protein NCTC12673_gp133 [Campylobacter phage NCTC12673]|uniref:Uncharacterized protein n=2 Tax=Fletchervirus NCTC12673 TaxID=934027 RepID=A0A1B0XW37_9CAUD|nr:hypothetical protein NCTC12673_gp133 [Campylobacter phage NCTC12673]YP_009321618.1 hypothetical protein BOX06_gp019 [Campylobacter phage PC14]AEA86476.1 hypothetical protein [Campylobacter phage NCTC12673]ANH51312.1 hypothetical protein PC14_00019 [Campylobacter phage PC14]